MNIFSKKGLHLSCVPDDWEPIFGDADLLAGANLAEANLRCSMLGDADLTETCFEGADLSYAFLNKAILKRANLSGACLRGADLEDADLEDANLTDADMGLDDVHRYVRLEGANLRGAVLNGANLLGALYDPLTIFPDQFDPLAHGMVFRDTLRVLWLPVASTETNH